MNKVFKNKKTVALLIMLIVIMLAAAGATIAYLISKTNAAENTFTPVQVSCKVMESFDGELKSSVSVANTSDVNAFIRAKINVNWVNDAGEVYADTPSADDYELRVNTAGGWWKGDDEFYYFSDPIEPKGDSTEFKRTGILITSCQEKEESNAPYGYHLSVEIIAEAIQADGVGSAKTAATGEVDRPAEIAWGVKVNTDSNGNVVSISK